MGKFITNFATTAAYEAAEPTLDTPNVSLVKETMGIHYKPYYHDYSQDYLTFVATESGTFKFSGNSINYSLDNGTTWTSLASNTDSPTVSAGSKIMWKATGLTPRSGSGIGKFSSSGNFTVEGNVMSLYYGDDFVGQTDLSGKNYAFYSLFNGCTRMTSAENLSLPATALTSNCYNNMFRGCTSLNSITCLATNISASNCTSNWVNGVAASGTFTKAASMTSWTTGANGIPSNWTVQTVSS